MGSWDGPRRTVLLFCMTLFTDHPAFGFVIDDFSGMSTPDAWPPDENHGPDILIACGICVGIALAMVLLRIYVRLTYTRNFGIDDGCIVTAMVC